MTAPEVDGVVLAAGLSTRAGVGKLTLEIEGQAILARCLESMYDACARIIVVTGHRRETLRPILRTYAKVEEVHNPDYASGMFGSVLAGVRQVKAERFFLTPGDYPLIAKSTYAALANVDGEVVIPVFAGKRGHPLLMDSRLIRELLSYPGVATLEDFILHQGASLVPVQDPGILMDVDTMEDFREILWYLAQARTDSTGR